MQVNFEAWSEVELRLKMENFIKDYGSLILLLLTIFIVAVGRIITNSQLCIFSAASTEIQITFGPNELCRLSPA
jgi:hypothetical protein